jgi:hypothetical protein
VAQALRESDPGFESSLRGGWMRAVNALANTFEKANPKFNRARFMDACQA